MFSPPISREPRRVAAVSRRPGRTSPSPGSRGPIPTPSLCLNGHTDVVPISPDGWDEDPFGGEVINNEVWGRGLPTCSTSPPRWQSSPGRSPARHPSQATSSSSPSPMKRPAAPTEPAGWASTIPTFHDRLPPHRKRRSPRRERTGPGHHHIGREGHRLASPPGGAHRAGSPVPLRQCGGEGSGGRAADRRVQPVAVVP